MWIERLDDIRKLRDLAPPLFNAAVGDVLDTCMVGLREPDEEWDVETVITWLRGYAASRANAAAAENDTDRYGEWSSRRQARLAAIYDGELEAIAEELDLAFARLTGRDSLTHETGVSMDTQTAAERRQVRSAGRKMLAAATNGHAAAPGAEFCQTCNGEDPASLPGTIGPGGKLHRPASGEVPGKICSGCRTTLAGDVAKCPACGGEKFRTMNGPAPTSAFGPEAIEPVLTPPQPRRTTPIATELVPDAEAPPATADDGPPPAGVETEIPVELIDPSPYQRRRRFDPQALADLAASIADVGLLQRITVRQKGGRYELVAGERRVRATKLAGQATIRATVVELTDRQAARACARENLDREDLDPIERAETLKVLLEVGGETQEQLAARLHKTQGWVSNQLRLLELPDDWRGRVITQEIPPTHARELLKWKHRPAVLKEAAKKLAKRKPDEGPPSVKEFTELVSDAARHASRGFASYECDFRLADLPPDVRTKLEIEEVEFSWGGRGERAFNTKLFDKLNKEARGKKQKAQRTAAARASSPIAGGKPRAPRGPSNRPHATTVERRVAGWLAGEVLKRIKKTDRELCLRLLLLCELGFAGDFSYIEVCGAEAKKLVGIKTKTKGRSDHYLGDDQRLEGWRLIAALTPAKLGDLAYEVVALQLRDSGESLDARILVELLRRVGGNPGDFTLTREDVELYPDEDLREALGAAAEALPKKAKRKDLVDAIVAMGNWLPAEFRQVLVPELAAGKKRKAKPR